MKEKLELEEVEEIKKAINYMLKYSRIEHRMLFRAEKEASKEEKDIRHEDLRDEKRDIELFEGDLYEYLLSMIRSMNALIRVEKDEDAIEKDAKIHNDFKSKIAKELGFLIRELRKARILDEESF